MPSISDTIVIRRYVSGDDEEIVSLLESGFVDWPKTELEGSVFDYWSWKYLSNPLGLTSIHLAVYGDRIVGCDHGNLRKIKIMDETYLCSCQGDMTVHPDFRGRGIWKQIREHELDEELGVKLVHLMTGNQIVINGFKNVRPEFSHRLSNFVFIKDIDLHLKNIPTDHDLVMKLGFNTLKTINSFRYLLKSVSDSTISVDDVSVFPIEVNKLWADNCSRYNFVVERTKQYLDWKYCDPRSEKTIVKVARNQDKLLGYIVLGVNRYVSGYPIGYIVDIFVDNHNSEVTRALVSEAMRYFEHEKINLVNYLMVNGHPINKIFQEFGFLDSRISLHMFYNTRELDMQMKEVFSSKAETLYFTWGDHDSLPVAQQKS